MSTSNRDSVALASTRWPQPLPVYHHCRPHLGATAAEDRRGGAQVSRSRTKSMQHGQRGNARGENTLRADPASVSHRKTLKVSGKTIARARAEVVQGFIEGEEAVFHKYLRGGRVVGKGNVQLAVHLGRGRLTNYGQRKHPRGMGHVVS